MMKNLLAINIHHHDYAYKCKRKLCYVCNRPVKNYKPMYCKCGDPDCELCSLKKPANIPICNRHSTRFANRLRRRGHKTIRDVDNRGRPEKRQKKIIKNVVRVDGLRKRKRKK